jgi:hypothetical protein
MPNRKSMYAKPMALPVAFDPPLPDERDPDDDDDDQLLLPDDDREEDDEDDDELPL